MFKKIASIIAAVLILGGGSYALHIYTQNQAIALIDQNLLALAHGGNAEHGLVTYSILRNTVTVDDIRMSVPVPGNQPVSINISKLTMVDASEDASAGRVTADQLTLEGITATARHPVFASAQSEYDLALGADHFSITNYAGPALRIAGPGLLDFNAKAALSFLKSTDFDNLTVANATLSAVNDLNSQTVTLVEVALADLKAGLLRSGGAIGITAETAFRTSDGNDKAVTLQMARTDHSSIDFGEIRSVLYPVVIPLADAPREDLVGASTYSAIRISGEKGLDGKIGSLEFSGFQSRPLPLPLDQLLQMDETTMSKEQSLDLFGSLIGVLQFGSIKLEDVYVASDAGEHLDLVGFSATGIGYTGFDSLNVTEISIANFPQDEGVQIDRIAVQSVDLSGFQFENFIPKMIPFNRLSKAEQRQQVIELISTLPTDLQSKIIGADAISDGKTIAHFDEYTYAINVQPESLSGEFTIALTGFDAASEMFQEEEAAQSLERLGLDRLAGNMSMNVRLSEDGKLTYGPMRGEIQNLARLDASAELVGLDVRKLLDDQQSLAAASAISLASFEFTYQDASLVQRGIENYATEAGMTPDQTRALAIETARSMSAAIAGTPFGDQALAAIEHFIRKPGSLKITARPEAPVPFTNIMAVGQIQPRAIPEMLNLTIAAE